MPPQFKFTREEMIDAALRVTRRGGASALTARALAKELGCSVKPIFGLFSNMEEVQRAVLSSAGELFQRYQREDMAKGEYPPYKASGMAYIRFAKNEKELFKLLFMRDRSHEKIEESQEEIQPLLTLIMQNLHLDEEEARFFHLELWIVVHGIATMLATSYLAWDEAMISKILTDAYEGLKYRFAQTGKKGEQQNGSH